MIQLALRAVYGELYLVVNREVIECDKSPATITEVEITWVYSSTPPYAFMAEWFIS
jgi:hypothetical protein